MNIRSFSSLVIYVCALACTPSSMAEDCEEIPLLSPARGAWSTNARPVLRWASHPQGIYRVQVLVCHPEGPILHTSDLLTSDTRWTLPSGIPGPLASVQVRITANCSKGSMEDLMSTKPVFFIHQPGYCALPPNSVSQQGSQILWKPAPGAQGYRIQVVSTPPLETSRIQIDEGWLPPKAQVIHAADSTETRHTLPSTFDAVVSGAHNPTVVVQARCGQRMGAPQAIPFLASAHSAK